MRSFPVQYLDITKDVLEPLNSQIDKNMFAFEGRTLAEKAGKLQNKVELFDLQGHLTNYGYIDISKHVVHLSLTYMQMLWMINYAAFSVYDSQMIKQELDGLTAEQILSIRSCFNNPYLKQFKFVADILDFDHTYKRANEILAVAGELGTRSFSNDEISKLYDLCDLQGEYGKKINGVYERGVAFVMLHEYAHHALGHKTRTIENEKAADEVAIKILYDGSEPNQKFSSAAGILSVLASFIMIERSVLSDVTHPDTDDRIFSFIDQVDSNHAAKLFPLAKYYLTQWAYSNYIKDFPHHSNDLMEIKAFMKKYKSDLNKQM